MKIGNEALLRAAIHIVENMRVDNLFTMSEIERQAYNTAVAVMAHIINLIKEAAE